MSFWKRTAPQPEGEPTRLGPIDLLAAVADPADRDGLNALVRPVGGGVVSDGVPLLTDSYAGGHPYLPTGMDWPLDEHDNPMHFLVQVNFANVAYLPGFPTSGLLQLFVSSDDTYGLTFDETAGLVGFTCRWFDADTFDWTLRETPFAFTPETVDRPTPLVDPDGPHLLRFEPARMLPQGWEHLDEHTAQDPHAFKVLETLWETHEDLAEATFDGWDVQVGGWPSFVQAPPRVPEGKPTQLLLALGSGQLMMWGDLGTAHLFGDPEALARGDLSGLWWEWSC